MQVIKVAPPLPEDDTPVVLGPIEGPDLWPPTPMPPSPPPLPPSLPPSIPPTSPSCPAMAGCAVVAAAGDGPLPIGDVVGAGLLAYCATTQLPGLSTFGGGRRGLAFRVYHPLALLRIGVLNAMHIGLIPRERYTTIFTR